jgi:hypothetical protein
MLVITTWANATDDERPRVVSNTDIFAGVEHRFTSTEPAGGRSRIRPKLAHRVR